MQKVFAGEIRNTSLHSASVLSKCQLDFIEKILEQIIHESNVHKNLSLFDIMCILTFIWSFVHSNRDDTLTHI